MDNRRLRKWPAGLLLFVFLTPCAAPVAAADDPAAGRLDVRGDRLFLPVRLNGVETADALLDSGAELSLVDSAFAAPAGVRLEMQTHKGLQTIPVSVEGDAPVQADFDLGNGNEVLVGAAYAERSGLLAPERIVGQKAGGGIGGQVQRDLVVLKELDIAGVTFREVPAAIDRTDTAADVNVGVRILRNFRMTVDFAENAVWLEPLAGQ